MAVHGTVEELAWESDFFALRSAIIRLQPSAPALTGADFAQWDHVQVKLPASQPDTLDALQQLGFQLVEGEIDLSLSVEEDGIDPAADIATVEDIPVLRQMSAATFIQSRFRTPWYAAEDSGRFYAQWIENAVKGVFDHQCLVFRGAQAGITGFVSLRQLNEQEARIGLLAGRGMGEKLMQAACHWARQRQLKLVRVATQLGNTAALKRYIQSGANVESTALWLYR
ncbi:dTDP-4-amino-4,6-dideoxy-D-galactose acyltransferase [Enterobacter sp. Bisph1]|uniref:dTDP-4-amino-4,6-dideoxy-D-galactose acyltransferase n=1 Tax=Enterobacter sp. Bisph1 TaxID=1274399 RepID=UPI00057BEFA6|nr:dTDP-4-amino-4,6-dideoxy-D-galactose acyltransferase [Enterobacter sp. Bisph1]